VDSSANEPCCAGTATQNWWVSFLCATLPCASRSASPMGKQDLDELYPRKFGKYHLLGPLAQGGMGALYLAVTGDRGLERLLVIKTILPHLADAEYIARFRDEAKVVIKLSHGNLIPVFDAGQVGGELFLAMDFVEGRDLRAVWNRCAKKQVAFPVDVAVYLVKELCRGLAYAHSFPDLELVHRDVSPPNILVSYTGEVKLTDFGLASSTLKVEKTLPGIMSPEQARGERLDGRSDMYAAGIVLWELLTGRQLFPPGKDQPADLVTRAKNPEVMRPSKRAPRVPVELDEICVRALGSERDARYASCDEMRQGLQSWLAQNAPTMDGGRISSFLHELFNEDVARERAEREAMMNRLQRRVMTLPPTHELRQIVERATGHSVIDLEPVDVPVRSPGSTGRRSTDMGKMSADRRRSADRRYTGMESLSQQGSAAVARASVDHDPDGEIDLIGADIDGRYTIGELIGEGGMGKVYLAEHIEIGKRVAIKVLHPSYSRMPELVERFRREARAASKIGHPNIVDVTDSGITSDGSVYFVMEYLEGVELGSVIERDRAIDIARGLRIVTQICRALAAAHSVGVIHRDLKPENVFLITRDNTSDFVKVLDFGIAKTAEAEMQSQRLTSPGMAMGTPEYMAPEQAAGRAADARCDIYSLAAILYEMLTGQPPYSGANFMEILTKKATVDPVPPSQLREDLPEALSQLILTAMSRNPDLRPVSMEAFEYELNKCLSGRGAAVAHVLGMTDPNLAAGLHPTLSGRVDGHEEGIRAPRLSSPMLVPQQQPLMVPDVAEVMMAPVTLSTPLPTAVAYPRLSWEPDPTVEYVPRRTGVGAFGVLLLLLLLGGAGVVAFVLVRAPAEGSEPAMVAPPLIKMEAPPEAAPSPGLSGVDPAPNARSGDKGKGSREKKSKDDSVKSQTPREERKVSKDGTSKTGNTSLPNPSIIKSAVQADGRDWADFQKKIKEYLETLDRGDEDDQAQWFAAMLRLARSQWELRDGKAAQETLREVKSNILIEPDKGEYLLLSGTINFDQRKLNAAQNDFSKAINYPGVKSEANTRLQRVKAAIAAKQNGSAPEPLLEKSAAKPTR
jgi:serine/threonine protein kinase